MTTTAPAAASPAGRGRVGARELLDVVLDRDSWQSWDTPPAAGHVADVTGRRRAEEARLAP